MIKKSGYYIKIVAFSVCFLFSINLLYSIPIDSNIVSTNKHFRIVLNFDSRNTFIRKESVKLYGIRFGFQYESNWRFGVGLYHNLFNLEMNNISNKSVEGKIVDVNMLFGYIAPFSEYVMLNKKKWEIAIPFEVGFGGTSVDVYEPGREILIKKNTHFVFLLETALTGHYKVFPWIGIGSGIGYRQVFTQEITSRDNLSALFYIIKIKIFPASLFK